MILQIFFKNPADHNHYFFWFLMLVFILVVTGFAGNMLVQDRALGIYNFGTPEPPKEQILYRPTTIKMDKSGNLFVLDVGNNRIVQYSLDGKYKKQIGVIGQGPGDLMSPEDMDVYKGKIYVLEEGNKRVSIFNVEGKFINSFRLVKPTRALLVSPNGEIYINAPTLDGNLFDVYSEQGELLRSIIPVEPFENPPFKGPNALATSMYNEVRAEFDSKGHINAFYLRRPLFRRFDPNGTLLLEKEIEGAEIDSSRASERKNLSKHQSTNKNPNSVSSTIFFRDLFMLDNDEMLVGLTGSRRTFFVFDRALQLKRKIRANNSQSVTEQYAWCDKFIVTSDEKIIGTSYFYSKMFIMY